MYFLHKNQPRLLYNKHKKQINSKKQHTGTLTKEPLCSETLPPLLKGAGVRWTPLRHSAEAPTEPAGETGNRLRWRDSKSGCRGRHPLRLHYCNALVGVGVLDDPKTIITKPLLFSLHFSLKKRLSANAEGLSLHITLFSYITPSNPQHLCPSDCPDGKRLRKRRLRVHPNPQP